VSSEKFEFDGRVFVDALLDAARAGFQRSKWKAGDAYEKLSCVRPRPGNRRAVHGAHGWRLLRWSSG
jgi:hypothetical protein